MASLKAMQTMQTQLAAQVTQVTESIAGLSGSFEGERSSHGPSTKEGRGELSSYVAIIGTQPPVSETLGAGVSSMSSLPSDTRPKATLTLL